MRYASLARPLAFISIIVLLIPSNLFVYADDDGTGTIIEDILLPEPRISHFPGENIELGSLILTYDFEDVRIPGPNGLDIVVGRKYKHFGLADTYLELAGFGSKFDFKIPFISVGQSPLGYDSTQSGFSCVMTAQTFGMNFYMPDQSMTTVGFSSSSLLPAGTLLAFTNNSVFQCENGLPVVRTSNGLKYVYGKKLIRQNLISRALCTM